jgi:hypothetical protein
VCIFLPELYTIKITLNWGGGGATAAFCISCKKQWRVELIFGEEQKCINHKVPFIHPNDISTITKHLQFKKYTYIRLICMIRCTYLII